MRLNEVLRYLGGASVVYVVVAACGGDGSGGGRRADPRDAANGVGGLPGHQGTDAAPADARAVRDVDLGDAIRNPVRDARAQDGTCGACSVSGVVRVATAETDPAQYFEARGDLPLAEAGFTLFKKITEGPLYLSQIDADLVFYTVLDTAFCAPDGSQIDEGALGFYSQAGHMQRISQPTVGRAFVPAGRKLCVRTTTPFGYTVIGFRPYTQ